MDTLSPIAKKIFDKFSPHILFFTGLLIVAIKLFTFTQLKDNTSFIYPSYLTF